MIFLVFACDQHKNIPSSINKHPFALDSAVLGYIITKIGHRRDFAIFYLNDYIALHDTDFLGKRSIFDRCKHNPFYTVRDTVFFLYTVIYVGSACPLENLESGSGFGCRYYPN